MTEFAAKKILKKYHPKIIGVLSADGYSGIKESLAAVLENKFSVRAGRAVEDANTVYEEVLGIKKPDFFPALLFNFLPLYLFKKNFPEVIILEFSSAGKDSIKRINDLGIEFDYLIINAIAGNGGKLADLKNLIKNVKDKSKIIINKDDKSLAKLNGELKNYTGYSLKKGNANIYALALSQGANKWLMCNGKIGLSFKICIGSTTVPVRMERVIGKEYVVSAIASYPVGLALGMNLVDISESLQNYGGVSGKMNIIPGIKDTLIINETRNISCDYIKEVLGVFKKMEHRRKIAVFGDILNLGIDTETFHRKIGRFLAGAGAEILVTIGTRGVFMKDEAIKAGMNEKNIYIFSEDEIEKAGIFIQNLMKEKDVLIVSGSEELRMEKIIKEIRA